MKSLGSKSPLGSLLWALPTVFAATAWMGCSASGDDGSSGSSNGSGGEDGVGGSGAAGQGGAGAGMSSGGSGGTFMLPQGGNTGVGGAGFEVCADEEAEAQLKTLDILVLLDRSGSMSGTKWNGATSALINFFQAPESEGTQAALQLFPFGSSSCNPPDYDSMVVDIGPIGPGTPKTTELVNSINSAVASGSSTPMYAPMEQMLWDATALQDFYGDDHNVITILVTDGQPNGCPTNPINQNSMTEIANLAGSAYDYNGVRTYVFALSGVSPTLLDPVAEAGGSGQSIDVTGDISLFLEKMEEIRKDSLECTVDMPIPMDGEIDAQLVNVEYTPGDGVSPTEDIPQVANQQDCGAAPGWYYSQFDGEGQPTEITLCQATCAAVQDDPEAQLQIVAGCKDDAQ